MYDYGESTYRKKIQSFQRIFEANKHKFIEDDNYIKEIQIQKDELYKIKRQVADQRREYNKLLVSDARADNLTDKLIESANRMNLEFPLGFKKEFVKYSDKEAVLALADWHFAMVTDNIWNKFNIQIAKDRIFKLVQKLIPKLELHRIKKLHIVLLGDMCHGAIHTTARIASEEYTSEQLMHVSEILAEVINELANHVDSVCVYSTYGNHMRTIQDKKDSIHSDNMEKIIPWWMKQRFSNRNDIHVIDSEFKEFIKFNVLGYNICCTHGDLDSIKNLGMVVNTIFSKLYGETIDYTLSADKHHLEEFERFGIESTLVRSLCGSDDYANDNRLYSNAGQTLMIFNEDEGKEYVCNIKLN